MNKKTVVIGASENVERYSNRAVRMLHKHGHEVVAVGLREGEIEGIPIHLKDFPVNDVDTISLYVGPANQEAWFDYMQALHPKRLILNPGTENEAITQFAQKNNIEVLEACTLVMLSVGTY